ncbi:MAG: ABC transporter ATP-binding protein, partial [Desulfobacteraceae bacterium]|nr:ABC transporter ATP-binding protein [Desulfobacteraceae bacterium]
MIGRPRNRSVPLLSIKDLVTTIVIDHGIVPAVNQISLDLHAGKSLGIVGESGSGKSILAKSIIKLLPKNAHISSKSSILFNGLELNQMNSRALNTVRGQGIAMIFQDPMSSLNPVMTIGHQIAESLAHHFGMENNKARNRSVELLKSVGFPNPKQRLRQYPHQLSGGMRQRVAIAISLACDPQILIADEPTTALDVTVQAEILDLLAQRQADKKMSMVLITHDLGMVAGRTDDIAVMYAGRIVEQAPARQLFLNTRMPYTQALLNSIPSLENPPHTRLASIEGHCPDLSNLPPGCSFAPRCPRLRERCTRQAPP